MCNTRISNFRWPVVLIAICALSACGESSDGDGDGILLEGLPGETTEGSLDDQMNSDNVEGENDGEGQIETGSENETETDIEDGAGNETENETEIEEETAPPPMVDRGPAELFGDALSDGINFVELEDLMADPMNYSTSVSLDQFSRDHQRGGGERFADQRVQTEGIIRGVCQRRGCWMSLRSLDDPSGENIDVRFLDYGFFVPLDARGALARVEGILHRDKIRTLSVEEVQSRLASGYNPGIIQEDGTALLIEFTATGVMMWNRTDN